MQFPSYRRFLAVTALAGTLATFAIPSATSAEWLSDSSSNSSTINPGFTSYPSRNSAPYNSSPYSISSDCSGYGCYGQPSDVNGLPRTEYVSGYTRSDGSYVNPYYRSQP